MKLFWKFFFTTMFVSVICLALGGYILINSNLKSLLDNEVQMAYDNSNMIAYSLTNELKTVESESIALEAMKMVASSISINSANQRIYFGIMEGNGNVIYSSLTKALDKNILTSLKENEKGFVLKEIDDRAYVQAIRPIEYDENTFYIETNRDVTYIFEGQKLQYETLLKIMAGMFFFAGIFTLMVSKLLVRRVVSLSEVTKDISSGNLGKRVEIHGGDEIAALSQNFNRMADELEEKIHALQDEATKKELFVGAFSHELKTPLTSIIGYSDTIRRKEMDKDTLHTCAEYIFAEGKRLEHLSMRLMDLIVLNNQELHLTKTKMSEFLKDICSVLSPRFEEQNIVLTCDIEGAIIELEPDLMKTVFINILDNAKKSMDKGGEIRVSGKWQGDSYIVSIKDTGRGMAQEELTKIKEAFYMVDKSRSREHGGVGLGLAITDKILKIHGFEITFHSQINIGTTAEIAMRGVGE